MNRRITLIVMFLLLAAFMPGCGYSWHGQFYGYGERGRIVRTAQRYLGVQYRHGGASPRGFDCSGYVMYVYEKNGILLPRSVQRQYQAGRRVRFRQAKPGDLVFFRTSRGKRLSHVGIYMGGKRFIHAPRSGKKVSYADMGKPYWKKRFIGAVTFI
ncbi:MAG TPA: C40 family peptidase [Spirochaetota bacterium]|nr:C40 family peptidase [Spirochaetota bacterium]